MGEIPTQHLEVMAESFRHDGLDGHHAVIRATLDGIADIRAALRDAEKAREEAERERDAYRHEWNVSSRQQGAETRTRYAAESRAARLLTAMKHLLKAFLMLHRACGTGSAEQWPEVEDARAAIAAEEGK